MTSNEIVTPYMEGDKDIGSVSGRSVLDCWLPSTAGTPGTSRSVSLKISVLICKWEESLTVTKIEPRLYSLLSLQGKVVSPSVPSGEFSYTF